MEWSVLSDPSANLSDDTKAELDKLDSDARTALLKELGMIVIKQLKEMIFPWFSSGMQDWADVDVYAAEMREHSLVLFFIAGHYNYNFAQSGSDWADHYVFAGEAHLDGGKLKQQTFALECEVHLTEYQHDDYSTRETIEAVRARLRAKRSGHHR